MKVFHGHRPGAPGCAESPERQRPDSLGAVNEPLNENNRKVAGLLEDRKDWRIETDAEGPHWLFGVDGEARLVITPEMEGFLMYRADQDSSWVIPRIESVEAWLDEHEHEHAGLTPLQEQLKAYVEEQGTGEANA